MNIFKHFSTDTFETLDGKVGTYKVTVNNMGLCDFLLNGVKHPSRVFMYPKYLVAFHIGVGQQNNYQPENITLEWTSNQCKIITSDNITFQLIRTTLPNNKSHWLCKINASDERLLDAFAFLQTSNHHVISILRYMMEAMKCCKSQHQQYSVTLNAQEYQKVLSTPYHKRRIIAGMLNEPWFVTIARDNTSMTETEECHLCI